MLDILLEINKIKSNEDRLDLGKHETTALKLTPEGRCCLSNTEKRKLATQLRDAKGPAKMEFAGPFASCRLLMNTVGKSNASYSPGTNDMASLPSAAPLVALIANMAAKLTAHRIRRVLNMALLKLKTLRMTLGDRWELAFSGPVVAKKAKQLAEQSKRKQISCLTQFTTRSVKICGQNLTAWRTSGL